MSYPKDLDEYTEAQLQEELARREDVRAQGRCDYCGGLQTETSCKFPERHHHVQTRIREVGWRPCPGCGKTVPNETGSCQCGTSWTGKWDRFGR